MTSRDGSSLYLTRPAPRAGWMSMTCHSDGNCTQLTCTPYNLVGVVSGQCVYQDNVTLSFDIKLRLQPHTDSAHPEVIRRVHAVAELVACDVRHATDEFVHQLELLEVTVHRPLDLGPMDFMDGFGTRNKLLEELQEEDRVVSVTFSISATLSLWAVEVGWEKFFVEPVALFIPQARLQEVSRPTDLALGVEFDDRVKGHEISDCNSGNQACLMACVVRGSENRTLCAHPACAMWRFMKTSSVCSAASSVVTSHSGITHLLNDVMILRVVLVFVMQILLKCLVGELMF